MLPSPAQGWLLNGIVCLEMQAKPVSGLEEAPFDCSDWAESQTNKFLHTFVWTEEGKGLRFLTSTHKPQSPQSGCFLPLNFALCWLKEFFLSDNGHRRLVTSVIFATEWALPQIKVESLF